MRIRLRPYHPTYVVCYFADQNIASYEHNKAGFDYVHEMLIKYPETEIELVQNFDDICLRCKKLQPNPSGSVWGHESSCSSSDQPEIVKKIRASNKRTLKRLGLVYGSVLKWEDLVWLLKQKMPYLDDPMIGGKQNQGWYEKGLKIL